jgi:hypothetical protein
VIGLYDYDLIEGKLHNQVKHNRSESRILTVSDHELPKTLRVNGKVRSVLSSGTPEAPLSKLGDHSFHRELNSTPLRVSTSLCGVA